MAETSIITLARRKSLCQITSGAIDALPEITKIYLGDGGVGEDGEPIPPSETDTALKNKIGEYEIGPIEYPVETTARYTITVPAVDLVGKKISEAALVDAEGTLCAIKTMYPKQKDDGVTFTFTFDDEF